jgi:hypothetical protein
MLIVEVFEGGVRAHNADIPPTDVVRVGGALGGQLASGIIVGGDGEGPDRIGYDHMVH